MNNLPPAGILAARLEHELYSAQLLTEAYEFKSALSHIERAQTILNQLREAMR